MQQHITPVSNATPHNTSINIEFAYTAVSIKKKAAELQFSRGHGQNIPSVFSSRFGGGDGKRGSDRVVTCSSLSNATIALNTGAEALVPPIGVSCPS